MSQIEPSQRLSDIDSRFRQVSTVLQPRELSEKVHNLEEQASHPDLWQNQENAQRITSELSHQKQILSRLIAIERLIEDTSALLGLASEEDDLDAAAEVIADIGKLEAMLESLETETLLNGEYDSRSAIMTIRSGAGGDDATDFSEMLMRMYLRYAEIVGMKSTVLETSYAEGAGIKSASIKFDAPYAYGKLSVESGTHRLVRMSPFNSAGKRQTSFTAVEVVPLIESSAEIEIPESDIRVDAFRSSGPGGQSVNTTDSAIRITHLPTGTVVSCQNEKSQLQNKVEAMKVLQSRLLEVRRIEEDSQKKHLAGNVKASWGEQMRSYVLAPYRTVKDLRTEHEENNPDDVFGGKLDGFISAGIKWRAQQNR
ncbi:peptide chain release factor 2 [Aquiluna sp.]|nr:peptide chain release factor 2 [Aquiluna sp.]